MYLAIVFLPLLAFIAVIVSARWVGRNGSAIITCGSVATSFLLSSIAYYNIAICHNVKAIKLASWFDVGILHVSWGFLFDTITVVMLIVVTLISSLVHMYSVEYMSADPHMPRFMSYLSLFTFFMLMLVTADNFVQMFFGWEGVGLASYLLINFWHTRLQANKSAIKAIIVNRIGDFGLSLAIFTVFYTFKSLDFNVVFALAYTVSDQTISIIGHSFFVLDIITFFLFIGAVGKSAQLGLHTWLPDAMEGPTPVSALIHAATMVTAGVFVLVRCSPLIEYATLALNIITIVGGLTAFFAATVGMLQNDIKRVIAYSTCSQLGYMVFACGVSAYSAGMFHLMNHAFFKALLFLGAGSVIHAVNDEQDIRRMGGLLNVLPFTYVSIFIGSLSLLGFPFLTGFYSKDFILEIAYVNYSFQGSFIYWLGTISAFFTAFYSFRLISLTFISPFKGSRKLLSTVHESPLLMWVPLFILIFGSIFVGYFFRDAFIGLGSDFWNNSIFILPSHTYSLESEFLPSYIKLVPVIFSILGAFISYYLYQNYNSAIMYFSTNKKVIVVYRFIAKRWYFDIIYNNYIVKNILDFSYKVSFKVLDRGFIEYIGPFGITYVLQKYSSDIAKVQSGNVYHYSFIMAISTIFMLVLIIGVSYWWMFPVLYYFLYFLFIVTFFS